MLASGRYGVFIIKLIYRTVCMLVFSFSISYTILSQELSTRDLRDSVIEHTINHSLMHGFVPSIILPPYIEESSVFVPISLYQSLTNLNISLSSQFQQQIDVVLPWKQELIKQDKLRTLRTILGAVQAGGTAYLLYEHIRKYGLK